MGPKILLHAFIWAPTCARKWESSETGSWMLCLHLTYILMKGRHPLKLHALGTGSPKIQHEAQELLSNIRTADEQSTSSQY